MCSTREHEADSKKGAQERPQVTARAGRSQVAVLDLKNVASGVIPALVQTRISVAHPLPYGSEETVVQHGLGQLEPACGCYYLDMHRRAAQHRCDRASGPVPAR